MMAHVLMFVARELTVRFSWFEFFMGTHLNPRMFRGRLDLKFFAEIRVSWMMLFFLTLSCGLAERSARTAAGMLSPSLVPWMSNGPLVLVLAHLLYANACFKGEECIPTTWDIFHEKFGWMLAFWNVSGVPFVYAMNSYYLLKLRTTEPDLPREAAAALLAILLCAYFVWDSSQSQKNKFRMREQHDALVRIMHALPPGSTHRAEAEKRVASMAYLLKGRPLAFPRLPGSVLGAKAAVLREEESLTEPARQPKTLLIGGWWKYARKVHYTADIVMAWIWALCCVGSVPKDVGLWVRFVPFFYPMFFLAMILHRERRDYARCSEKYGALWDRYVATVPYAFLPGVV